MLTIHVFSERSCRFKKEFWAKIRGMSSQKGGSVEELKKLGWGAALAFFDGLPMEEVKKRLGATCASWGLEDFEELRQEAKKQKVALDREENLVKPILWSEGCDLGSTDRSCCPPGQSACLGDDKGQDVDAKDVLADQVSEEDASCPGGFPARED